MAKRKYTVVAIDDEQGILRAIKALFKNEYNVLTFSDPEEALSHIRTRSADVVLLDVRMGETNGIDILNKIILTGSDAVVIMVTAMSDAKTATLAMRAGAYDYVVKPFDDEELRIVIEKAIEKKELARDNNILRTIVGKTFDDMIGGSPKMTALLKDIDAIARSDSSVMITGETGSGKEMVARSVHKRSKRAERPFIAINCAAIPETLFESELFGYERGAFTGAFERKPGKFELADGGTIFLDEIGCLPQSMQAKLLRVLQEGEITRIGGVETIPVDVRVICATNADLKELVLKGSFRDDLYYRLNVIPVNVPPLRERGEDIIVLISYFLDRINKKVGRQVKGFDQKAIDLLCRYRWPGNIRELINIVERTVVLARGDMIGADDLPCDISQS